MSYRTFIAVDVEPFTRDRLRGIQEQLAAVAEGVRWVDPDHMHLTLLFLGELNMREIPAVCKAAQAACASQPPFEFTVAGLGAFPTPRRPKTLIAKITDGAEQLKALQAAIEQPLAELGLYRREERPFTPHITIGRVKKEAGEELGAELSKFAAWQGGSSRVREAKVYSSSLQADGPEYTVLGRGRLAGSAR